MLGSLACYKEPLGSSSLMQSPKAVWFVTFLFATNAELNILARRRMCHTKREARENSSPRVMLRPLSHKKSESKKVVFTQLILDSLRYNTLSCSTLVKKSDRIVTASPQLATPRVCCIITRRLSSQSPPEHPWGGRERRKPNEQDKAPGRTRHIPRSWDQSWRCRSATRWFSPRC